MIRLAAELVAGEDTSSINSNVDRTRWRVHRPGTFTINVSAIAVPATVLARAASGMTAGVCRPPMRRVAKGRVRVAAATSFVVIECYLQAEIIGRYADPPLKRETTGRCISDEGVGKEE